MAQAFPNLTGQQIIDILFRSADELGAAGTDATFGHGRLNIERAFQPIGTTTLAGTGTPVTGQSVAGIAARRPPAPGDASRRASGRSSSTAIRAPIALDLVKSLEAAEQRRPLEQALTGRSRTNGVAAGPVAVSLTVAERDQRPFLDVGAAGDRPRGCAPVAARRGQCDRPARHARRGSRSAFREGAKSLERDLSGAAAGAFLVARDTSGEPGFAARARVERRAAPRARPADRADAVGREWRGLSRAPRRPARPALSPRDRVGRHAPRPQLAVARRDPARRAAQPARRADERRAWRRRLVELVRRRRGAPRLRQRLQRDACRRGAAGPASARASSRPRPMPSTSPSSACCRTATGSACACRSRSASSSGGLATMLPTGYDYATGLTTSGMQRLSLSPSGREIDAELSYGTRLGTGWIGGNLYARRQPGHDRRARARRRRGDPHQLRFLSV